MAVINKGSTTANILSQEARLRKLELAIDELQGATSASETTTRSTTDAIPEVSGLSVVPNLGTITFQWNELTEDVRYYEVQVATNSRMTDATTYQVVDARFTYQEGLVDIPYYVRVRAATTAGTITYWTDVINSLTGKVATEDMEENAASALWQDDQGNIGTLTNNDSLTSPAVDILTEGGLCLIFVATVASISSTFGAGPENYPELITTLVVDGTPSSVFTFTTDFSSNIPDNTHIALAGFQIPVDLDEGHHTIAVYYETVRNDGSNSINIEFITHLVSIVELRTSPSVSA